MEYNFSYNSPNNNIVTEFPYLEKVGILGREIALTYEIIKASWDRDKPRIITSTIDGMSQFKNNNIDFLKAKYQNKLNHLFLINNKNTEGKSILKRGEKKLKKVIF